MTGLLHALAARTLQQAPGVRSALAADTSSQAPVDTDDRDPTPAVVPAAAPLAEFTTRASARADEAGHEDGQVAAPAGTRASAVQALTTFQYGHDEPARLVPGRSATTGDAPVPASVSMPPGPAPTAKRNLVPATDTVAPRAVPAVRTASAPAPSFPLPVRDLQRAGEAAPTNPAPARSGPTTEVHVHIGRVELTALASATPARERVARPAGAMNSLADYLKRGPGGWS